MSDRYAQNRANREFDKNPPSMAPGQQGFDDDSWGDMFATGNSAADGGDLFSGSSDVNSILSGQSSGNNPMTQQMGQMGPNGQMGMNGQLFPNQQQQRTAEDIFFDTVKFTGKGLFTFFKELFRTISNNTKEDWYHTTKTYFISGMVVFVIGLLLMFLHIFIKSIHNYWALIAGGGMSAIIGVIPMFRIYEKYIEGNKAVPETPVPEMSNDLGDIEDSPFEFVEDDGYSDEDAEDSDDEWDSVLSSLDSMAADGLIRADSDDFNVNEAVDNISVTPGMFTRQYLFETFMKVLPIITPNYQDMEELPDGCDEFMEFEEMLRQAAIQAGTREDKLPYLTTVRKNLFVIQLIADRPTGLKEEEIAMGVAQQYQMGGPDGYSILDGREGVYASVASVVGKLVINIFMGKPIMVSLGSVYNKNKDFILNPKCTMPLVWGVNEMGKTLCYDGMRAGNGGMLISGEARSGKSWKGQSIIAQMCMFMSPKELNFYFFDVKGSASDYFYLSRHLPHAKGFYSDPIKFGNELKGILDREVSRREKLLGTEYTNVKDYNKDHLDEKIPTIYIVVDEMAAAMKAMDSVDKEIHKDFDNIMVSIATKYPYLEIKLLVFPHRIVNDIISKTVSSMISCRSVMGSMSFDELKGALDIPNRKAFPYNLVAQGDMAIRSKDLSNGNAVYCHAEVLSNDESINRKIFDYIGKVWMKIEPDCGLITDSRPVSSGGSSLKRESRPPKDNSFITDPYSTPTRYVSPSNEGSMADDFVDSLPDVDESFWDDELGRIMDDDGADLSVGDMDTGSTEEDDGFWDSWKK